MNLPILSLIIFLPILGMAIVLFTKKEKNIRWIALAVSLVNLLLTAILATLFDKSANGFQFVEKLPWIKNVNINYFLGIDGISITLLLLTTLLSVIAVLFSFEVTKRVKEYFVFFLILETGMLGTFCALDLILFYFFWEIVLVPMFFLIGIWGGERKKYASIKFFLYTLAGSVLMLLGILALYFSAQNPTFSIPELISQSNLFSLSFQKIVFVLFFIGFAIKVPIFPFHTWLPDAHVEAPTAGSVILAGVLLKMGAYGLLRVSWPILPEATKWFAPILLILAFINIIYGAFLALAQNDLKKLVAYSSISHMGYVLLGLASLNEIGTTGAVFQMFSHGILSASLFMLVGVIYSQIHTKQIRDLGGLASKAKLYAAVFALITFGSIGLPGLIGFPGEFLSLTGAFSKHGFLVIVATLGIVLGAGYMLWTLQRVMLSELNPKCASVKDLDTREKLSFLPLVILTVIIGILPSLLTQFMNTSVLELISKLV